MVPLVWLVSVLTGLAALALALNVRLPILTRIFFCGFLVMIGTVALLLGLRLAYGAPWAGLVQPHLAAMIAPLAYLGFWSLTQDDRQAWRRAGILHGGLIAAAQLAMLLPLPLSTDVILFVVSSAYLAGLARFVRFEPDAFVALAPTDLFSVRLGLFAALALLALMVAGDVAIVAALIFAPEGFFLPFLGGVAGFFSAFIVVLALVGIPLLVGRPLPNASRATPSQRQPTDEDERLFQALTSLMEDKRLFTDSNLTLARIARRLGVPARDLSQAVNRKTGENVTRTINGFRIRSAQAMLRETDLPVTEIMLSCGFLSKSSFNTDFRRITGQTPSQYRAER